MGFWGGPTDRVGDSFNFFVYPLSKLCVSDAQLRVREKHDWVKLIEVLRNRAQVFFFLLWPKHKAGGPENKERKKQGSITCCMD